MRTISRIIILLLFLLGSPCPSYRIGGVEAASSQSSRQYGLTSEDLVVAKKNGIIAALCYVVEIITGKTGRAVVAVAVLAVGWIFILGGVKWTTILMFTLACSLTFGGVELANVISRNKYSCLSTRGAEEAGGETTQGGKIVQGEEITYNRGLCSISIINEYVLGQVWYLCSSSNNDGDCKNPVTSSTLIDSSGERSVVALIFCQAGYYRFREDLLHKQTCKMDKNGIGYFVASGGDEEDAKCRKSCLQSELHRLYTTYNLEPVRDSSGQIVILENAPGIRGRAEGSYYVQKTILDMDCKNGFIEFDAEDNPNPNGARIICSTGGAFQIEGSCRKFCSLDRFKDYGLVSGWQRCDGNVNNCLTNDSGNLLFEYGEVARIKSCKINYSLEDENDGLAIVCGDGGDWRHIRGFGCRKICRIGDMDLGGDSGWNSCDSKGVCTTPLAGDKTEFTDGDVLAFSGQCVENYSIDGSGKPMKFSCDEN
ncbi:MAG: hypothetical protein LBB24_02720, partial [Rickettsiales bacterium]|nr:hypothetical protein [Rickettsiales bacterium]